MFYILYEYCNELKRGLSCEQKCGGITYVLVRLRAYEHRAIGLRPK